MDTHEDAIERLALLSRQAALMSRAVLQKHFDEARVRLAVIVDDAAIQGRESVSTAARRLARVLGEPGSAPGPGYGAGILELAEALDAAQADLPSR